jgi:hypothetical protein
MSRKKSLNELLKVLGNAGLQENVHPNTLNAGVEDCERIFEVVVGKEYERVQGIGDDFIPDTDIYNAVGAIYPALSTEQRDAALRALLSQFDRVRYDCVQNNHTPYIREPLVHADLWVARAIYWPGLDEGKLRIKEHGAFDDFRSSLMSADGMFKRKRVNSDFCVAYAALRSDFWGHSREYADAVHAGFLERVLRGITNMRFGRAENDKDAEEGRARLLELLPERTHALIDKYIAARTWIDHSKFR